MRKTCFLAFILFLFSCGEKEGMPLRIATAANMQFAMEEIIEEFEATSGSRCEIITGSSGLLKAQIENGAPYDLFFSADMNYPNALFEAKLTEGRAHVYATGKLVWVFSDLNTSASMPELLVAGDLLKGNWKHLAMPNPEIAPYGRAAKEALSTDATFEKIEDRLVFGESVGQTNQFLLTGAAELGLTSMSSVIGNEKFEHWEEVDPEWYHPIDQGYVVLNSGKKHPEVDRFVNFMNSDTAKHILMKFGYSVRE